MMRIVLVFVCLDLRFRWQFDLFLLQVWGFNGFDVEFDCRTLIWVREIGKIVHPRCDFWILH